jgi:hypothetical protein
VTCCARELDVTLATETEALRRRILRPEPTPATSSGLMQEVLTLPDKPSMFFAKLDRMDEARAAAAEALKLNPNFTIRAMLLQ